MSTDCSNDHDHRDCFSGNNICCPLILSLGSLKCYQLHLVKLPNYSLAGNHCLGCLRTIDETGHRRVKRNIGMSDGMVLRDYLRICSGQTHWLCSCLLYGHICGHWCLSLVVAGQLSIPDTASRSLSCRQRSCSSDAITHHHTAGQAQTDSLSPHLTASLAGDAAAAATRQTMKQGAASFVITKYCIAPYWVCSCCIGAKTLDDRFPSIVCRDQFVHACSGNLALHL